MHKVRITKANRDKLDRLKNCLDMCCMPWVIHNGYVYIRNGKCTDEQVRTEIKRALG